MRLKAGTADFKLEFVAIKKRHSFFYENGLHFVCFGFPLNGRTRERYLSSRQIHVIFSEFIYYNVTFYNIRITDEK